MLQWLKGLPSRRERSRTDTTSLKLKGYVMPLSSGSYTQPVWIVDLSGKGIRIASAMALPPGFDVLINIPFNGRTYEFTACVVWSKLEQGGWSSGIVAKEGIEELESLFQTLMQHITQEPRRLKIAQ